MSVNDRALFNAAEKVRKNAHVPYSNFRVGAAILAEDGNIYAGCNVENAAYPQSNCAEAGAISIMIAGGQKKIKRLYIIGPGVDPVMPCGGCRQKIREFAAPDVVIISHGVDGEPFEKTLDELLPFSFGPEFLGVKK
jgi:cytidine deaminase